MTNELNAANQRDISLITPRLPHIFYGGDYNPEQWPSHVWPEDARLMQEAGVNLVTLGVFSWAKLEPQPGQYDWEWLDRVMDLMHQHGIAVDLATATASPPPWLTKLHPEILPVTRDGVTLWPGSRQQYCPSNPAFREAIGRLVKQMASRYGSHPALVMWHISNEYGCHVAECYCEISAAAFRSWLKQRYESVEQLNFAWGTAFWSQQYGQWDEIAPPRRTPTFTNPTQLLDWKRFCSDALLECFELEKAILKEATPNLPITTNFMGFFKPLDYWKWVTRQDVVSHDSYPDPFSPTARIDSAITYDLMRSLGGGKSWILMEQTTSQVNWRAQNALKRPGQMRLLSHQAVARGAGGIMFFQWRASLAGSEKFHGAMIPHVGIENSRVWREVKQLGQELKQLDALLTTSVQAKVAIMFDWESWWALETENKPSSSVKLMEQVRRYYEPLFRQNIAVDFIAPGGDLSHYKVVLVPNLYLVRAGDRVVERLEKFVSEGGKLVMSFFSGIVDENEHVQPGGYPASFRKLLGLRVEEFDPYAPGQTNSIKLNAAVGGSEEASTYQCELWSDVIDLEGAEALASYETDFYEGRPALTRHQWGAGASYYLGTSPEAAAMEWLLAEVCREAGVQAPLAVPAGVEVVRRENSQGIYLFVLNHNAQAVELTLTSPGRDLLTGQSHAHSMRLEAMGVAILSLDE